MNHFKNRHFFYMAVLCFTMFFGFGLTGAEDLKVSMAYLPDILETPDKGVFVDIVKSIDDVYEGHIERKVFPFARSMDNVITGKADFHLPMIRNKIVPVESLPYAYTTEKMGDVYFIIYSNTDNPIPLDKIKSAKNEKPFPLRIESMGGFLDYFDFPITESFSVESSLKKVDIKRIDAFIFAQEECDFTVKQLKLKNVHRELYDRFDDVFVIPKGDRGKEIDAILSACIEKLKSTGEMQKLHLKVHLPYQEWQPNEMGW
ncbi:MAG: transporter substrate-binding domain-containing protein [Proteobacteria bacterium]|nr:transporter substrate-binding domain-containing protein [Pseudomonadota bacterium]